MILQPNVANGQQIIAGRYCPCPGKTTRPLYRRFPKHDELPKTFIHNNSMAEQQEQQKKQTKNFDKRPHRVSCRDWRLNYPFCWLNYPCVHHRRVTSMIFNVLDNPSRPPSNAWFLGPTRVSPLNDISIGTAFFAGHPYDQRTDIQANHATCDICSYSPKIT